MFSDLDSRDVAVSGTDARLLLGRGALGLEVLVVTSQERPGVTVLRELFKTRLNRRATPVLVVARWGGDRAAVYGPTEHNPVEHLDLPQGQVESICRRALEAPDRHQAIRILIQGLPQLDEPIPGLRNGGLLAMQELLHGVPRLEAWDDANRRAQQALSVRGRTLIQKLGFVTEDLPGPGVLLLAEDRKTALAVLLDRPEEIDAASDRFDGVSAVSYGLSKAEQENLDYVVVVAGSCIRLYPTKPGVGPGRRGRSETFVELDLDLLPSDRAGYLWLLLSASALAQGGSFEEILARSADYAAGLGERLRDRVYLDVIPRLARSVVRARDLDEPSPEELDVTYQLALRILYRLLFVAYAEDRDLLPLHESTVYREHSLKRIAQRLVEVDSKGIELGSEPFYWNEVRAIWRAVSRGNAEWSVPRYNGSLFASDKATSALGARLEEISLSDREFVPALSALLLDETEEGVRGPVDFRSLGVREFGTIYEGLLESELSLAETDLTVEESSGSYLPAGDDDVVEVRAGEVYIHNRSGARKSSGSYYTKSFAVEHLLDRALEPALAEHLERLDGLSDREAGRRFFEFRVADIAMGSGHFLVAAVDRVERGLVSYLARRPLPDVQEELSRLRRTALDNLGPEWTGDAIEDARLLRRQVARRCIFGVDKNPMAVELARLSIWIHTFVPGLPLSLLDQNLVHGNALVGIATFEEASELMRAGSEDLFSLVASERLADVREPLERLGRLTDATDAEIREARELYDQVKERTESEAELMTVLSASRTNSDLEAAVAQGQVATTQDRQGDAFFQGLVRTAEEELAGLDVFHFPLAFPHVFLGGRKGFDVILGNPPWEKPMVEEHAFWARHFPGFRAKTQRERESLAARYRQERPDLVERLDEERAAADRLRSLLIAGPFPGITAGHPDLYKAFVWRFWHLVAADGGSIGVVLPRSALAAKGGDEFRKAMLNEAELIDMTMLVNNRNWVFEEVHPQYTIGLAAVCRRDGRQAETQLNLKGPYASLERFRAGAVREPVSFYGSEVREWNDTASLPLLPSDESAEVFAQLRKSPRLDLDDGSSWRARPIQGDLNSTTGKPLMDLESVECPPGFWPVFKGESFDLWTPDTGTYYAWVDPEVVVPELQGKRERATSRSAFAEFTDAWRADPQTLPCLSHRLVFRRISRATDSRTMRAALVPAKLVLTDVAPYFLWPRGGDQDVAFLLGVLSSIPLDWYARRFVETHLDFHVVNPLPVPRSEDAGALRERVVELAGRLASPDQRFAEWAATVGVECGPLEPDENDDRIHELDAVVAHLYGLTEAQLTHIFETFHEGWDYEERLRATLRHFEVWKGRA